MDLRAPVRLWSITLKAGFDFPSCKGPITIASPNQFFRDSPSQALVFSEVALTALPSSVQTERLLSGRRIDVRTHEDLQDLSQLKILYRSVLEGHYTALGFVILCCETRDQEAQSIIDQVIISAVHSTGSADLEIKALIFTSKDDLRKFFQKPSTKELDPYKVNEDFDPYGQIVEGYVNERSCPSGKLPSRITGASQGLRAQMYLKGPSDSLLATFFQKPDAGYVRFVSDQILEQAIGLVPRFVRTTSSDFPSAFFYARYKQDPNSPVSSCVAPNGRSYSVRHVSLTQHSAFSFYRKEGDWRECIVGEIRLLDLRREDVAHSDLLGHHISAVNFPRRQLTFLKDFSLSLKMPNSVYDRIMREAPDIKEISFSVRELDQTLVYKVLYECARVLWYVLPREIKLRWAAEFPFEGGDRSAVYFRNLIRMYTREGWKKEDFSASTFADVVAFYWLADEMPEYLQELNEGLVDRHIIFLDDLMEWAQEKRERCGNVFVLGKT